MHPRIEFAVDQGWTNEQEESFIMSGEFPAPITSLNVLKHFRYSHTKKIGAGSYHIILEPIHGGLFDDVGRIYAHTHDADFYDAATRLQRGEMLEDDEELRHELRTKIAYNTDNIIRQINENYEL